LHSRLLAVERVPLHARRKPAEYTPLRFVCFNKVTKHHRMLAVFDAIALSEAVGQEVTHSKIVHGDDHAVVMVKTSSLAGKVRKLIAQMEALVSGGSPPELVLIRHCAECEFRDSCRQKAVEKDELTLLTGMTQKQRDSYRAKGLFTITQLSYTFRPRRTPKRTKTPANPHHYPLQALAIREKTVFIHGTPALPREEVEVYFDIEGLPDRDSYYLIGALVVSNGQESFHSFWADSTSEQQRIFSAFAGLALQYPTARLFHYGDYDALALKRVASLCQGATGNQLATIEGRCFNVLSVVYPHVYFPTYSNGLKDIGQFLEPSAQEHTGLQTIIWRTSWETTRDEQLKNQLVAYNRHDCETTG